MPINQKNEPHDVDKAQDLIFAMQQGGTIDYRQRHLYNQERFVAGHLFTGISNGSSVNVVVENNSTDGYLVATQMRVQSNGEVEFTNTKNVTIDSAGTQLSEVSLTTSSPVSSEASVQRGVSVSGGTDYPTQVSGAGSGAAKTGFTSEDADILINPEDNMYVTATNTSGTSGKIAVQIAWSEISADQVDALQI